jgi:hypothetical protein
MRIRASGTTSWILMRVEDREIYHWDAGGEWCTQDRWDYIIEGDDVIESIKCWPELNALVESGPEVFMILFADVSFVTEDGYWDLDYGYVNPCGWVECDQPAIVEHDFDPAAHGLVSELERRDLPAIVLE